MKLYMVRRNLDNKYLGKGSTWSRKWVADLNEARTFKRKCDIKNAIKATIKNSSFIVSTKFEDNFSIVECNIVPDLRFKVTSSFRKIEERVFSTRTQAQEYLYRVAHKNGMHTDYFQVEETVQPLGSIEHSRPSWDDYFFGFTYIVSKRSHDIHTQCGCVIVDKDNHILGTGYNGFPRGMNDSALPTHRPDKYAWMIHAEINAVSNCIVKPIGATAYVSAVCCHNCIMHLWQNGVDTIKFINRKCWTCPDMQRKSDEAIATLLKNNKKIKFIPMEPDLDWLLTFDEKVNKYMTGNKLHQLNGQPL